MIDKIYVIHLEPNNHVDDVLGRLNRLGVPEGTQYEIVQAYDGRYGDLPEGYSTYSDWAIEDSDNKWYNRPVKPGEAGCMISHIMVWEKMIEDGVETRVSLRRRLQCFRFSVKLRSFWSTRMGVHATWP